MSVRIRSSLKALLLTAIALQALPAAAQVTSLSMTSDPGDYIGAGQTWFFTQPADGIFFAQINSENGVSLTFHNAPLSEFWTLDFAAPNNQSLTVGTYSGAMRFQYQTAGSPGLQVTGDGRGCNTLTGSFQVLQVVYGFNYNVVAFDATFEQHCEGLVPALRGEIRYNASVGVALSLPTHVQVVENQSTSFTVTATDTQGLRVVLTASNLPAGASFVDLGNSTGSFSWTPTASQEGSYTVSFQGSDAQGNTSSASTDIVVVAPPPANDDFGSATAVSSIPYTINEDATSATVAPDDPYCYGRNQTVWFAYTPQSNIRLEANTFGSNYDTTVSAYTGTRGALTPVACNDDSAGTLQSRVRFDATAGTTYYFMASTFSIFPALPANLAFNLKLAPPPFTFTPTVAQFGSVTPSTGAVTINGSVTCSEPAYVTLYGQLKQMRGGVPINGFFSAFVPCDGTASWSSTLYSQTALFHGRSALLYSGGKATVTATAFAFDPDTGEFLQVNFNPTITLTGAQ
jgi:Putative Ig domain